MRHPRVSCVIPVHNGARFIAEAIESVLAQTLPVFEIIVVDDGSTDETLRALEPYGPRVKVVSHREPLGPAAARNRGSAEATGDFVTFLDHDDLWDPHKLELQHALFETDPTVDYCVAMVQNFWMPEVAHEAERFETHMRSGPIPGYVAPTLMVRKSFLDRVGGFNEEIAHADDADWFLRARAAGGREVLLDEVLLRRRLHLTNRSRLRARNSRDEYFALLKSRVDAQRVR
jgi:glycosyltransferase involved in cell wall biosynthesis